METNISPNIGDLGTPQTSAVADSKQYYPSPAKAQAFEIRYGKPITCSATIERFEDGSPKEVTLRVQSAKNNKYVLNEVLTAEGNTDYVTLAYTRNNQTIETRFNRYLDAEVTLADLIAEE